MNTIKPAFELFTVISHVNLVTIDVEVNIYWRGCSSVAKAYLLAASWLPPLLLNKYEERYLSYINDFSPFTVDTEGSQTLPLYEKKQ